MQTTRSILSTRLNGDRSSICTKVILIEQKINPRKMIKHKIKKKMLFTSS